MGIPASRQINNRIKGLPPGVLFSRYDFGNLGLSDERINTELSRLFRSTEISRKKRGLYYIPKETPLGPSTISPEQLAKKMLEESRRIDKKTYGTENKSINRLIPAGLTLFNVLGLSTQVPARKEYWSTFNLETPTLVVKKMPMEKWATLTDFELMLYMAIAFLNRVSGENVETVKNKINLIIDDQQIQTRKLVSLAKKLRSRVGKNVMDFFPIN